MIAAVVPSCRPESLEKFKKAWTPLFEEHDVDFVVVRDGDDPTVLYHALNDNPVEFPLSKYPEWRDVVFDHTDACRNFGFLWVLKELYDKDGDDGTDVILTLDDDLTPYGNDPIQEHLDALFVENPRAGTFSHRRVPIAWFPVASEYTRGFPYGVRDEAEVWLSHGVWEGVHDHDGPTQLVCGNRPMTFYKGVIPKGCLFPCSGMNLMWPVKATPYMYYAPMGKKLGVQRFADIWMGTYMKRRFDLLNKAVVSGYSTVYHDRASNVFANLEEEARGIRMNEQWDTSVPRVPGDEDYWRLYSECLGKWESVVRGLLGEQ